MNKDQIFEKVYKDHSEEIFRFCKFRAGNNEEAEDVTAESFIRLYENEDFDFIENKRAWLYKVSRNMIINNKTKMSSVLTDHTEDFEAEVNESLNGFENEIVDELTVQYIESELKNLDEATSEIIVLRIWDELSFDEIASIVDLGVDAVKKRFYRGINDLRNLISRNEKSLNIKSISVPLILAGIFGVANTPAYAMTASTSAALATSVGTSLGITLSTMINSSLGAAASASATTAAATGATTAGTAAASGMFATATVKIIAASALAMAGAGVAFGVVSVVNQPESYIPDTTQAIPENNLEEEIKDTDQGAVVDNGEYTFNLKNKFVSEELGIQFYYPDGYKVSFNESTTTPFVSVTSNNGDSSIVRFSAPYDSSSDPYYNPASIQIAPDFKLPSVNLIGKETNAQMIENFAEGMPCNLSNPVDDEYTAGERYTFVYNSSSVAAFVSIDNSIATCPGFEIINPDKSFDELRAEKLAGEEFSLSLAIIESVELPTESSVSISEFTRICTFPSIGLEFYVKERWTCEAINTVGDQIQMIEVNSSDYQIIITSLGRGPYCYGSNDPSESMDPINLCIVTDFIENKIMSLDKYTEAGKLQEIFGILQLKNNDGGFWSLSINENQPTQESYLNISSSQERELINFLSTFVLL